MSVEATGVGIAEVREGRLIFDGADVVDLAGRITTPFFLYSPRRIRQNVNDLRDAFAHRHTATEVFYATKACSMMWFLRQVQATGINAEVNAGGELWKALQAGFRPDQIVFTGGGKTRTEVSQAIEVGIRSITVDSLLELDRVAMEAQKLQSPARVALRVDVNVSTRTHPGMTTTRGGKAGIELDEALEGYRLASTSTWLDPCGLHMHIGSQITSPEPYVEAMETALDLIAEIERRDGLRLDYLNAGGGFPIPYKRLPAHGLVDASDYFYAPRSIEEYADAICTALRRRRLNLRLFLEPGRAIAADAAVLVTTVQNRKTKYMRDARGAHAGQEQWLTVDAGYNTLLEHCLYSWYYPALVATRLGEPATHPFRLAGPLCDGGDVFVGDDDSGYRYFPEATGLDDLVVFGSTGGYGLELMTPCNARPRAAAYAVEDGRVYRVRREETNEDMIAHDESWQVPRGF